MRILMTGGTGVLGTALRPMLSDHDVVAPSPRDLDLFNAADVMEAVSGRDAVVHLATRIPSATERENPGAWDLNDRLRMEASQYLVDALLNSEAEVFVVPTVTFVYPPGAADETTPLGDVPEHLQSALCAEAQAARVTIAGRRGVVLRFGLLWGPGTGSDEPNLSPYGSTLKITKAAQAIASALEIPGGIYNVVDDGQQVSNAKFRVAAS